jgi:hypothetical protein
VPPGWEECEVAGANPEAEKVLAANDALAANYQTPPPAESDIEFGNESPMTVKPSLGSCSA